MGRINGWQRTTFHSNLEEAIADTDDSEQAVIAEWWHPDAEARVKHIYEPSAERPFIVRLTDDSVELEQEGQYEHRNEGGSANKALMRNYP